MKSSRRLPDTPPLARLSKPAPIVFNEHHPAGLQFTERMAGWWSPLTPEELRRSEYHTAFLRGRQQGTRLELVLTIESDDLEAMLRDPQHLARFVGTGRIGLPPEQEGAPVRVVDVSVSAGRFRLFIDGPDGITSRSMQYMGQLSAGDGTVWDLDGFKAIRHGGGLRGPDPGRQRTKTDLWRDQTRLFFTLSRGGTPIGLGILILSLRDFLRQLLTLRAPGALSFSERADTIGRFLVFFGAVLRDTYGGPLARSRYAPPDWWRRPRRALQDTVATSVLRRSTLAAELYLVVADDGIELQLTRYRGSRTGKGPVIAAPGFGVAAASFAIDTVEPNFVEYLCGLGYDVWLFDYRASPALAASRGHFFIDDIATRDWPAAIDRVRQVTGQMQVRVVAHCVGAMSFMMAALAKDPKATREGTRPDTLLKGKIRCAILSQVGAFPVGARLNELRAVARMGTILDLIFGVKALPVTVHAQDPARRPLFDALLKLYPTDDPCDNPVCRRIRFVFGESYLHANLNRGTHDAIIEMFGDPQHRRPAYASLRALRQLLRIVRLRRIVDHDGQDVYLPNVGGLDFPLRFLHGARNAIFPPEGTRETVRWLRDRRPDLEVTRHSVPAYAHMDCFIGHRAAQDVFPVLADLLHDTPLWADLVYPSAPDS